MLEMLLGVVLDILSFLILDVLTHAWVWWALAAGLLGAALWWRSVSLAIAAAIVVALRLMFAWLERQAGTQLVESKKPGNGK